MTVSELIEALKPFSPGRQVEVSVAEKRAYPGQRFHVADADVMEISRDQPDTELEPVVVYCDKHTRNQEDGC